MTTPIGQDAIQRQNQRLLERIADKIVIRGLLAILFASAILAALGFALIAAPGLFAAGIAASPSNQVLQISGVTLVVFAASAVLFWVRARKARAKAFAAALDAIVDHVTSRERLQIERIVPGGKVCDVIDHLKPRNGSMLDIMWTFFYREEHTKGLMDLIREQRLKLRIILVAPWCRGLALRVSDLKEQYKGDLALGLTELSLDNLNFIKDVLAEVEYRLQSYDSVRDRPTSEMKRRVNEAYRTLKSIKVRFVTHYVGRPMIIVKPGGDMNWRRFVQLARYLLLTQIWSNYGAIQERLERAAIGLYLSREASRYHFLMFRSDASNAHASGITRDMRHFFQSNWLSAGDDLEMLNFAAFTQDKPRFTLKQRARLIAAYVAEVRRRVAELEGKGTSSDFLREAANG